MIKKIIPLSLAVMLSLQAVSFASLPNYKLPETSLEKLKNMPNVQESLKSVYDSALKGLEEKGFGKNNYPNGFGELQAPSGFGVSANELYKSKFGNLWFDSAMNLSAVNANIVSKPSSIKITGGMDLTPIYNNFKSALKSGSVDASKNAWAAASGKFTMPTREEIDAYEKIDSEAIRAGMKASFDHDLYEEIKNRKKDDNLGGSLVFDNVLSKVEDMGDSIKRVGEKILGFNTPIGSDGSELPNFNKIITNGYDWQNDGFAGGFRLIEVQNFNKDILINAYKEAGHDVEAVLFDLDLNKVYRNHPEIYEAVRDQLATSYDDMKQKEKNNK